MHSVYDRILPQLGNLSEEMNRDNEIRTGSPGEEMLRFVPDISGQDDTDDYYVRLLRRGR